MGQFRDGWRRGELFGLIALVLLLMLLARLPIVSVALYPFVLFKTFVHELWHGLAAVLSGGRFLSFDIHADSSGLAWTQGGSRWFVASAGYLGASFTGGVLLVLGARGVPARALLVVLGAALILASVFLAGNVFGRLSGLALGAGLLLAAVYLSQTWRDGLLLVLAVSLALDALNSLLVLTRLSLFSDRHTDAATMAELTGIPALFWAALWIALSLAMLALALRLAYRHRGSGASRPVRAGSGA